MKLTGENWSTRGKTCPSATLSTTNSTWTDLVSNPGLLGERPATNRLSHVTTIEIWTFLFQFFIFVPIPSSWLPFLSFASLPLSFSLPSFLNASHSSKCLCIG
jgi:hypothetical protein